ncbi:flagellar basal-body MS-ring/collar protein FliF [Desulfoferrobacter suflitae]|uniref:flagellar basal-body MS-ring/collar protein FliF n=1 Tax=Desulfoferrobacter suflitae TaxID=2865782 RepID=UPI002164B9C6|nr:flagellar basal-body MS-ring/collar protein FliF [Desulfoferrobacter suflitae]MCK8602442.1 flagellar M-ring protein FliF [Desulfoferrobacter suflitae]
MNKLVHFLKSLKNGYAQLPTPQKIFYAGSLAVLLGSLLFLAYTINRTEYSNLYTGLSEEDLSGVVAALQAQNKPYKITGNSIAVPAESLYETRMALAQAGLPKGGGVGFEIFDEQKLGSTEFVQKINYQRALQGELARTINRLNEVQESRVHLVLPSESVFVEDQKPPSAAVVLKLRPGTKLDSTQIQGIVNLVASTVQGLPEDKVTIMTTDGQVLSRNQSDKNPLQLTNLQMQYQESLEESLRRKVQSLLEAVVGAGRVMTRVSANLDFSQVQTTEDTYDPDSAVVRSQQRSVESSQGGDLGPKGNPDIPINAESQLMQNAASDQQGEQKKSSRQRETVNYEINHVTRQITQSLGTIKKLSVAVVIDGPYETKTTEEGNVESVFAGYPGDQLKSFEEIVKKAVGYDETRGDQVSISNVSFASDYAGGQFVEADNRWLQMLKENHKIIINLLLVLLVFLFVVRPFMRRIQQVSADLAVASNAPAVALPEETPAEDLITGGQLAEKPSLRNQAVALVRHNPERAAEILRSLLREEK